MSIFCFQNNKAKQMKLFEVLTCMVLQKVLIEIPMFGRLNWAFKCTAIFL